MYESYTEMLRHYLQNNNESTLYHAQQYSKKMIEQEMSPEEMVSIHISVFEKVVGELPKELADSFDLLLEVMVGYGLAYREHLSLKERQREIESELLVARKMQNSLLPSHNIEMEELELGVVSIGAGEMSGDYYYHDFADPSNLCITIADIIGKGIPAAMCMSMIKYAMDSLPELCLQPAAMLESLNRVVERNIDSDMFITMIYGSYDLRENTFYFASAGHEPGFLYSMKNDRFEDLITRGLVLGVSHDRSYQEYAVTLEDAGDFIVLLTDGVTDCRVQGEFISRQQITEIISKYKDLSAQLMTESVYEELQEMQNFQLKDDFTLIILRRKV